MSVDKTPAGALGSIKSHDPREALRLAFEQHKALAVGLSGQQQQRTISDMFEQTEEGATLVTLAGLDLIVGSGGVLSHAPPPDREPALRNRKRPELLGIARKLV